ncbi:hypothetical protein [Evansella clarkii]|uniref:hypothetical protein n=1 Tax=Evansella clarkii TaxID=79879 RepID=UPI000B438583|nr:hypothetical protein [Evansella clarkii]
MENVHVEEVVIAEDWIITQEHVSIIDGVTITITDKETAELWFGDSPAVLFDYNAETRDLIENIDSYESIEFLALIYAHRLEG